jgi:phage shock protein A
MSKPKHTTTTIQALPDVAQYEKIIEQLRDAAREARGVLGDLKRERREVEALIADATTQANKTLDAFVLAQVTALGDRTKRAIDQAEAGVYKRFDKLTALLMGEENNDPRPSLEDLARTAVEHAGPVLRPRP